MTQTKLHETYKYLKGILNPNADYFKKLVKVNTLVFSLIKKENIKSQIKNNYKQKSY